MFPPFTLDTVRWRPLEGEGLEYPAVRTADHGHRAESTVIGENEAPPPYGARYHLDLGEAWHGRTFVVEEPAGRRTAGCTDTDLAGSTPTTTLPNRRPCLATGDNSPLSTMAPVPSDTFTADLPVDAEGFVTDYPTLFARL